jgi:hypothetical protein
MPVSARVLALLLAAAACPAQQVPPNVAAILNRSCVPCHNAKQAAAKLRLDSHAGITLGGSSGAALVPGASGDSRLYQRIADPDPAVRMPPASAPLPPEQIAAIKEWIDGLSTAERATDGPADYERDIKPILRSACYPCHSGPKPKSMLRLDAKSTAMKGGIGGRAILPGDSANSRIIHRIEGRGGEPRMPLGAQPLKPEQVALLKSWIDSGAAWPDGGNQPAESLLERHWSYKVPRRPAVPEASGRVANPIDAFVLATLKGEGLAFSPQAAKEKLIRRASLDLIGLPPTPDEVAAFVADERPDAYQRLVDRLLASPHFGERQARPWLDYARYADTNGFEADHRRTMWKYRDWVIEALNSGMPFDKFTVEQIAGDLLPNPTTAQKIATGFHRNTMMNEEGGVDKDQAYFEVLVDRVNTTSTVWLGSTLGCAQCHNHKYDPFTHKDYYRMMAFFAGGEKKEVSNGGTSVKYDEPVLELPTPDQDRQRSSIKARMADLQRVLDEQTPALDKAQREWEQRLIAAESDWSPVRWTRTESKAGAALTASPDGAVFVGGENAREETYVLEGSAGPGRVTALRLEALPDQRLPRGGPGRDAYGNFLLAGLTLELADGAGWKPVSFASKVADNGAVDHEKRKQLWIVDASQEDQRVRRQLLLTLETPLELKEPTSIRVALVHSSPLIGQSLGNFRISLTGIEDPRPIVGIDAKLRRVLNTQPGSRSTDDAKSIAAYHRSVTPSLAAQRDEMAQLKKDLDALPIVTALVMAEKPDFSRPFDFVRARGTFSAKGEKVEAGVPVVLGQLADSEIPNRLALARWLVGKENPLTARVVVNRIWEQYFGRGLVETSEDFGSQGQTASHPELLDWLAVEFAESGWDLKHMHRLIVTSETYRQSSAVTPALLEKDPNNRLLARGPRARMEAEMIRDVALAVSGLLTHKIGGPSVFPPQPPGIWDLPYNDDQWVESEGGDRYRRGLYTFQRRSAPYPAFMNFDGTSREFCTIRRSRTTTPLQALTTLNDTAFFEAAQALGRRMLREGGTSAESRIGYGFRLCTSRMPSRAETEAMLGWQEREREYFRAHTGEARELAPDAEDPIEAAVWAMTGNVLLNLDETLTKE